MLPNNVLYWSGGFTADADDEKAYIEQDFLNPILARASDYLVCVERCEINLNAISFYRSAGTFADTITLWDTQSSVLIPKGTATMPACATFLDFLEKTEYTIQQLMLAAPANDPAAPEFRIDIDRNGYVRCRHRLWNRFKIIFGDNLARILGFSEIPNLAAPPGGFVAGTATFKSRYPRLDVGDELGHVVLTTNLPVVSDRVGQVKTNVIADFAISSVNTMSEAVQVADRGTSTYSHSPRQRMIYVPNQRRFLNMNAASPVYRFGIRAHYVDADQVMRELPLPIGGIFNVKLGFYSIR